MPDVNEVCQRLEACFMTEDYHCWENQDDVDNIDVYCVPFAQDRGVGFVETERIRLLLLKFERIANWPEIVPDFLTASETEDFNFRSSNLSENKHYSELYREVKKRFAPTLQSLDNKLARHRRFLEHFYGQEQTTALELTWRNKIEQTCDSGSNDGDVLE